MFNIGFSELLLICVLALIFIGPKQLPEVARAVGKFLNELRRASDEAMKVFRETQIKPVDFVRKTEQEFAASIESKPAAEKKPEEDKS